MKITLEIPTRLTVEEAWRTLTNWRAHGEWIPLTKMIIVHSGDQPSLGDKFIGRSGIWPLVFDDVMTVTRFDPPGVNGFCEVTKSGRLVKGSASFTVSQAGAGTLVTWVEDIPLPPLVEKILGGLLTLVGKSVFTGALRKALNNQ
jgi:hypothetical protein